MVTDVGTGVDRGAAVVEARLAGFERLEGFDLAGQGITESEFHLEILAPRGLGSVLADEPRESVPSSPPFGRGQGSPEEAGTGEVEKVAGFAFLFP